MLRMMMLRRMRMRLITRKMKRRMIRWRMMIWRRRKMMMLRRIMWRSMMNRKIMNVDVAEDEVEADDVEDHEVTEEEDDDVEEEEDDDVEDYDHVEAQDGTDTVCKPGQSKCTWTCHTSHFIWEFTGKRPRPRTVAHTLCEPAPQCGHTVWGKSAYQKFSNSWFQACSFSLSIHPIQLLSIDQLVSISWFLASTSSSTLSPANLSLAWDTNWVALGKASWKAQDIWASNRRSKAK